MGKKYTKAQKDASLKYARENLKRIPLDVKRQYYDEVVKPEADKRGLKVRQFILQAIDEKIQRES